MLEMRITVEGVERLREAPKLIQKIIRELAHSAEQLMKEEAPYKTGQLRSSIRSDITPTKATVAPHVVYGAAQNYGLPPGPGRYVPAIGKRLTPSGRGWWPGFKGKYFVEKSVTKLEGVALQIIEHIVNEHFRG